MEYKDRSTALVVFGVLTTGLGCLFGLMTAFILLSQLFLAPQTGMPLGTLIPAMSIYVMIAAALIWLGIGSMMATRWARALLLIGSWSWLIFGSLGIASAAVMLPVMINNMSKLAPNNPDAPALPAAAMVIGLVVGLGIDAVFLVVIPAVWTYFYGRHDVKATCEARHPQPGWTDACPLPVLAVVCWLAFSVPMMLVMTLSFHGALPFFGLFLTGVPGSLAYLILGALYGLVAWLLYRLDVRGWWLLIGLIGFFMVSGIVTFMQRDVLDMYRTMNFPPETMAQMERMSILKNKGLLIGLSCVFCVPMVGYLIFIRRYLRRSDAA